MKIHSLKCLLAVVILNCIPPSLFAQGTAFTYQGALQANGTAAAGSYDLKFTLFDVRTNGTVLAGPVTNAAVTVSHGLFTTLVDFGGAGSGASNWLEIAVSTNGANAFATLSPRQPITPVPSALYALAASNVLQMGRAGQLTGTVSSANLPASVVTTNAIGVALSGSFSGNGGALTNVPGTLVWQRVTGTNQQAQSNTGYLVNNPGGGDPHAASVSQGGRCSPGLGHRREAAGSLPPMPDRAFASGRLYELEPVEQLDPEQRANE